MKKKLAGIILMSTLAFQLVACGSAEVANAEGVSVEAVTETESEQKETAESGSSTAAEETSVEEVSAESKTTEEAPKENDAETKTNDFCGQYYAGKGNLSITDKGDGNYLIEVIWQNSMAVYDQWTMNAKYDDASKTLTYSDCEKHEYTLKDNGEIDTDVTEYNDGTGSIKIVDGSTIMWTDDQDHIADDVPMTR